MADLTTVAKVKEYLGITVSDYDAVLAVLVTAISAAIEKACNRTFDEEAISNELYSLEREQDYLTLKKYPVDTEETFVLILNDQTIDSDDYYIDAETGTVKYPSIFPKGNQHIDVSYTAGFDPIPEDIEQAANEAVAGVSKQRGSENIKSEKIGDYAVVYQDFDNLLKTGGFSPSVAMTILLYKNPSV